MDDLTASILKGERGMTCGVVLNAKRGRPEDCTECRKKDVFRRTLEENELKGLRAVSRLARRAG